MTFPSSTRRFRIAIPLALVLLLLVLHISTTCTATALPSTVSLTADHVDLFGTTPRVRIAHQQFESQRAEQKVRGITIALFLFIALFLVSCIPACWTVWMLMRARNGSPSWAQPSTLSPRMTPGYALKSPGPSPMGAMPVAPGSMMMRPNPAGPIPVRGMSPITTRPIQMGSPNPSWIAPTSPMRG